MSWRERYKNHEARFDHHIKTFQHKNKLSRQAIPMGSEAMLVNGMEDLNDFGTDEEEEDPRPRGKKAARVDSDTDSEYEEPVGAKSRPVSKTAAVSKQPTSKRKRVSDASDRTSKRTRVIQGSGGDETEQGTSTSGPTGEKEDDVMDQDSQGEETLQVEQDLFNPSDEDSVAMPRWVILFSYSFRGIHVSVDHTVTLAGAPHRSCPPNPLGPMAQRHPPPRTDILPNLVNRYTDLTVPKILPLAFSQQSTSMNQTQTYRSSQSAFGNEQSQRSSKVRSVGTNNPTSFVHLKSALTRHQDLISLLRDVRLGRRELLDNLKLVQPGRI